jgi:hypothetical protein
VHNPCVKRWPKIFSHKNINIYGLRSFLQKWFYGKIFVEARVVHLFIMSFFCFFASFDNLCGQFLRKRFSTVIGGGGTFIGEYKAKAGRNHSIYKKCCRRISMGTQNYFKQTVGKSLDPYSHPCGVQMKIIIFYFILFSVLLNLLNHFN